jgi:hypothetical protein
MSVSQEKQLRTTLPPEEHAQLRHHAASQGLPMSELTRQAVRRFLSGRGQGPAEEVTKCCNPCSEQGLQRRSKQSLLHHSRRHAHETRRGGSPDES